MPELPDVACFQAIVQHRFVGRTVARVVVPDPASVAGAGASAIGRRLNGRSLQTTGRHGKYLWLDFGAAAVLVMHFGPAGLLRRVAAGEAAPDFVRFRLEFSNGEGLAYVNRRRIGRVRLVDDAAAFIEQAKLGPDALDPHLDRAAFTACVGGRTGGRVAPIKAALTDQSRLAGIGNTWSDEILFRARIHPATGARDLTATRIRTLFRSMRDVLRTATDLEPCAPDFLARLPKGFLLPHRHPGGHCPRCGTELQRAKVSGHTSTFCPRCQPG